MSVDDFDALRFPDELRTFLRDARRCLRPGGTLVARLLDFGALAGGLEEIGAVVYERRGCLDVAAALHELERAGFSVVARGARPGGFAVLEARRGGAEDDDEEEEEDRRRKETTFVSALPAAPAAASARAREDVARGVRAGPPDALPPRGDDMNHEDAYDERKLAAALRDAGFARCERRRFDPEVDVSDWTRAAETLYMVAYA
ncbi:hypothetical protein JL721_5421 [Aureococcus anophagefferens]|nr:hypothetical protein JL721_5421 [Aureococcus anophagefferens]